jgi:hypothetical protein
LQITNQTSNCKIKIHNQWLILLIFKGIIDLYAVDLIVFPNSSKNHAKSINTYCNLPQTKNALFTFKSTKQKTSILARHLRPKATKVKFREIQNFLNKYFPLEIVSQTTNASENQDDVLRYINEAISKHDIDMLVQTRSTKKIKFKKKKEELHEKVQLLFCRYMKN